MFQYYFGEDILVAPVTQPLNSSSELVFKDIWIPEVVCIIEFQTVLSKNYRVPTCHGLLVK